MASTSVDGQDEDGEVGSFHAFDDRAVDVIVIRQIDLKHRERRGASRTAKEGIEIVGVAFNGSADLFERIFRQMAEGVDHIGIGRALGAGDLV